MILSRGLRIGFLTHKASSEESLGLFNGMRMIDFLRKALPGSIVDGICLEPGYHNFNTTFDKASKSRYDLFVVDLYRKYDIEDRHCGFIAMNKFIANTKTPVLMLVHDYAVQEIPATNMSGYDNRIAVIGEFTDIDMKSAGYGNVVFKKSCDAMPSMLTLDMKRKTNRKIADFMYAGALKTNRTRRIVDAFNALTDAGFVCKFYGSDRPFDDMHSDSILSGAKFECLPSIAASKVVDVMSESRFSIVPRYDNVHDVMANRIYEDDKANALMLVDIDYGLGDMFDVFVRYSSVDDLVKKARGFLNNSAAMAYQLSKQHMKVQEKWTADRSVCVSAIEEAVRSLLV